MRNHLTREIDSYVVWRAHILGQGGGGNWPPGRNEENSLPCLALLYWVRRTHSLTRARTDKTQGGFTDHAEKKTREAVVDACASATHERPHGKSCYDLADPQMMRVQVVIGGKNTRPDSWL